MDKLFIKVRVKLSVDCVVEQTVTNTRFVNVAWFWVGYIESVIWAMNIGFVFQISVQFENIIH